MSPVGVTVQTSSIPSSTNNQYSTSNAFVPILADWGPTGQAISIGSLSSAASQLGTPVAGANPYAARTATSQIAIDAADTMFKEAGAARPILYASRVVGPSPVAASLQLRDGASAVVLTVTAQYVGAGGNGIYVAVTNSTTTFSLTLQDANGSVLASQTGFATTAAAVTWLATTGYATGVAAGSTLPATIAATALSGGTDNRASLTIANVNTALSAFSSTLGPGQVFAPNWTNTTLSGIWSAVATHGLNNNRVAICDMDDNTTAGTAVTALGSFGTSASATYAGFWAGNRLVPGIAAGTNRSVPPSAVIAGLCSRVDLNGNTNIPAAGTNAPLLYATQPASQVTGAPFDTYSLADLNTLNAAGINTFQRINGVPSNYGFVSTALLSSDPIYWQLNHARLRMFIVAQGQLIGQSFMFSQIDGQQTRQNAFGSAIDGQLLQPLWRAGALYGATQQKAYSIDVSSAVNTPATIAAGQLNAAITCSFSYFAQNVTFLVNVQPITNQ